MVLSNDIKSRRSIRKYDENVTVSKEEIEVLLEAAMHAPSAHNLRPWEFIVVTNREKIESLATIQPYAKILSKAHLAIIVCGLPKVQEGKAPGFFPQDCAAATQNILIQATSMDLGSCWVGVYPHEEVYKKIQEMFDLPDDTIPFNVIAIGSPDENPKARGFFDKDKVRYVE